MIADLNNEKEMKANKLLSFRDMCQVKTNRTDLLEQALTIAEIRARKTSNNPGIISETKTNLVMFKKGVVITILNSIGHYNEEIQADIMEVLKDEKQPERVLGGMIIKLPRYSKI